MNIPGNTVGSTGTNFCDLFVSPQTTYFLGLWCADGYHRTSSVGLSNVDKNLILSFRDFLLRFFPIERLRLRIYVPERIKNTWNSSALIQSCNVPKVSLLSMRKASVPAVHVYVNSRPFLRLFRNARECLEKLTARENISAYFAGRFDGDGSLAQDGRSDCRIVYTGRKEAEQDEKLLQRIGITKSKIYHYKKANTYCLYISRFEAKKFVEKIREYSRTQKLVPVPSRDLV